MSNLSELLQKIDSLKTELDSLRPLSTEHAQRLRAKLNLEWNYHSNAIEGNTLTLGETRAFLYHGITAGGKPFKDYLDIKGHKAAIEHVEAIVRAEYDLTEADIRHLHEILLIEPYEMPAMTSAGQPTKRLIRLGQYKSMPNHVRTATGELHFYASPEETPAKMGDLMQWYRKECNNANSHPVTIATLFHYRFVAIHPFDDGNGRMARLLMNLALMQAGYVPVVIRNEQRDEYLLALSQADVGDIEPFFQFIADLEITTLEMTLRAARGESLEEPDDLDKRLELLHQQILDGEKSKPPRSVEAINFLANTLLEVFLKRLGDLLPKFNRFFNRHQPLMVRLDGYSGGVHTPSNTIELQFRDIIQHSKNGSDLHDILFVYQWLEFIKEPQIRLALHLNFEFEEHEFICTVALMKNGLTYPMDGFPITLIQTSYDHEFTESEIEAKLKIISDALYNHIESLLESSTRDN